MKNLSVLLALLFVVQSAFSDVSMNKKRMFSEIDTVANLFRTVYGPKEWKAKYADWNIDTEAKRAKKRIAEIQNPTVADLRQIIRDMVLTTQDYHVSISFFATESASLPFAVKGADGKYFIVYIDRTKLPEGTFPFNEGDEIVNFDGKPIEQVIFSIKEELTNNIKDTDQSLAEMMLTRRRAARGMKVPNGPISIDIKKLGDSQISNIQLMWEHEAEQITNNVASGSNNSEKPSALNVLRKSNLKVNFKELEAANKVGSPFALGARSSYLPTLGKKIWEAPDTNFNKAYIFQDANKRLIGYIRIPAYDIDKRLGPTRYSAAIQELASVIRKMEEDTEALVIDQINNPGGSVFYLYALASMLTQKSMSTPLHRMSLYQENVSQVLEMLNEIKDVKNDEDAKKVYGEDMSGYPVSYSFHLFFKQYAEFVINEWKSGKLLSAPTHLFGVERINQHPDASYSKPILLLVNELDFSGGDFFPAIMQDNKRAVVLGTRTSGAGGYVEEISYPNLVGISGIRMTGSIAERVNKNPLENLGVTPDISYSITADDLQSGFRKYKSAVLSALEGLFSDIPENKPLDLSRFQ